ncbi:MAG: hypothetical protein J6Y78_00900, partial [Paludibacteraceae bacterium]|nr:hypothetical protein [Paludibacteraceae bacterium]
LNSCNDFKIHREMSRILSEVEKDYQVEHRKVVLHNRESEQWKKLDSVMNIATIPELKHICCNHPSPTVRMAMFLHVVEKYPHEAVKIAIRKVDDFDTVYMSSGCEGYETPLSCARYEELYRYHDFEKRFTNEEMESLEKTMVQSPHFKYFVINCDRPIYSIKPRPEYYQFLKDYYNKTKSNRILIAILKYNKPKDRPLIFNKLKQIIEELNKSDNSWNREDILYWISKHPEDEFEPYVKQIMTTLFKLNTNTVVKDKKTDEFTTTDEYYIGYSDLHALLAYKKKWAYDLLEAKIKEDIEEVTMEIDDESDYFKPLTDRIKAAYKKQWED